MSREYSSDVAPRKNTSPKISEAQKARRTTRPGAPKSRAENVEKRVLDAAVVEFAEHGFAGARIERISQRAKTVDRMLYYYFANKVRLYQVVLEKIYADLVGAQRDFVMPDDAAEGMRQLIEHSWDHYVEHPHLVRLLMNENLLRGKHIQASAQVERTSLPLVETVSSLLASGQAKGVFRQDVSSEHVLMTIMSLGYFYVSNQYTCSRWIGTDLMTPPRRAKWRAHISDVVLEFLKPRDSTVSVMPAKARAASAQ